MWIFISPKTSQCSINVYAVSLDVQFLFLEAIEATSTIVCLDYFQTLKNSFNSNYNHQGLLYQTQVSIKIPCIRFLYEDNDSEIAMMTFSVSSTQGHIIPYLWD